MLSRSFSGPSINKYSKVYINIKKFQKPVNGKFEDVK